MKHFSIIVNKDDPPNPLEGDEIVESEEIKEII